MYKLLKTAEDLKAFKLALREIAKGYEEIELIEEADEIEFGVCSIWGKKPSREYGLLVTCADSDIFDLSVSDLDELNKADLIELLMEQHYTNDGYGEFDTYV